MPLRVKEIRGAMFCILAVLIYLGGELKDPRQNKRFKKIIYLPTSDWVTLKNNSTWVLIASSSIVSGALSSNFDEDSKVIPV
jgi:hypothetical protein